MSEPITPKATIGGIPIHAMLVPFPIVCFVGALLTDIAYANTAVIQWTNFSQWLLAFGTLFAGLAAVFGLIDFFFGSRHKFSSAASPARATRLSGGPWE